jgi:hypothetical protein
VKAGIQFRARIARNVNQLPRCGFHYSDPLVNER